MASELRALCKDDREKLHVAKLLIQIPPDHTLAIKADLVPVYVPHHLLVIRVFIIVHIFLSKNGTNNMVSVLWRIMMSLIVFKGTVILPLCFVLN